MAQEAMLNAMREAFEGMAGAPRNDCPVFDGNGNVNHWLLSFDLAAQGKNEAAKLSMLTRLMKGAAYNWFCAARMADMAGNVNANSDQWKQRLRDFFGKTQAMALDELEARRQRENEDATTYIRDMLRLCADVDPAMPDATKLRHLQKGLLPRFSRDMMLMDPVDTATFQMKLMKLMSNHAPTPDIANGQALFSALLSTINKTSETPVLAVQSAPAPTSLESKLDEMIKRLDSLEQRANKPRRGCFNCGKFGHRAADCRQPRKQDSSADQQAGKAGPHT